MATTFTRKGSNVIIAIGDRSYSVPSTAVIKPCRRTPDFIVISNSYDERDSDAGIRVDKDDVTGITFSTRTELIEKLSTDFFFSPLVVNEIGGQMVQFVNKTGAPSVKGQTVSVFDSLDNAVQLCPANADNPIGVFYTSGVADGQLAWIVMGGIADIMVEDNTAVAPNYHIYQGAANGRAGASSGVNTSRHWGEIGHALQSVSAGTNKLVRCIMHFN